VPSGVTVNVTVTNGTKVPSPVVGHPHHPGGPLAVTGMETGALFVVATALVAASAGVSRWRNRSGVEDG
jgi:hypothetical protein